MNTDAQRFGVRLSSALQVSQSCCFQRRLSAVKASPQSVSAAARLKLPKTRPCKDDYAVVVTSNTGDDRRAQRSRHHLSLAVRMPRYANLQPFEGAVNRCQRRSRPVTLGSQKRSKYYSLHNQSFRKMRQIFMDLRDWASAFAKTGTVSPALRISAVSTW